MVWCRHPGGSFPFIACFPRLAPWASTFRPLHGLFPFPRSRHLAIYQRFTTSTCRGGACPRPTTGGLQCHFRSDITPALFGFISISLGSRTIRPWVVNNICSGRVGTRPTPTVGGNSPFGATGTSPRCKPWETANKRE